MESLLRMFPNMFSKLPSYSCLPHSRLLAPHRGVSEKKLATVGVPLTFSEKVTNKFWSFLTVLKHWFSTKIDFKVKCISHFPGAAFLFPPKGDAEMKQPLDNSTLQITVPFKNLHGTGVKSQGGKLIKRRVMFQG